MTINTGFCFIDPQISMSVILRPVLSRQRATKTPTVLIPRVPTSVCAKMDSLGMEKLVQVINDLIVVVVVVVVVLACGKIQYIISFNFNWVDIL